MKAKQWLAAGLLFSVLFAFASLAPTAAAADRTTKYRVYQNNQPPSEFVDRNEAIAYAKRWAHSYVEQIDTREWVWNNFPRYRVYQFDVTLPHWEFATLSEAIAEAKRWSHASVRDLQGEGWAWDNYPRKTYRVYQSEITLDQWEFASLDDAIREARKWANSHIIDQSDNRWVWDNLSDAEKQARRQGTSVYRVYQGTYSAPEWQFAYLEDAVREALKWADSHIVNTQTGNIVYRNARPYVVFQFDNRLQAFASLGDALAYAKLWAHARIEYDGRAIWTNEPYYRVYQNDNRIGEFKSIPEALAYAKAYANSSIRTPDGGVIWDNLRKLLMWAWNGVANDRTIREQVAGTMGLDIDSPTWFQLADADGALQDDSSKETADWLKQAGYQVHPLVGNKFDKAMTTAFLANPGAQDRFISTLVSRAAELGVHGLNLDFENVAGSDRRAFTEFVRKLSDAAHARGLKLSIDLPRGSVKWNHLTAFDHAKLKDYVDWIVIMAYDQHWSDSPVPGSVAGLAWTEEGVREFLSYGIPRDKIMLGVPFYVREWTLDAAGNPVSNRALLMKDLPKLIADKKASTAWDETFGQYRVEYVQDGQKRVFWLEDEASMQARFDIAKKYDLAGVAAWRLGYDPKELWNLILRKK